MPLPAPTSANGSPSAVCSTAQSIRTRSCARESGRRRRGPLPPPPCPQCSNFRKPCTPVSALNHPRQLRPGEQQQQQVRRPAPALSCLRARGASSGSRNGTVRADELKTPGSFVSIPWMSVLGPEPNLMADEAHTPRGSGLSYTLSYIYTIKKQLVYVYTCARIGEIWDDPCPASCFYYLRSAVTSAEPASTYR